MPSPAYRAASRDGSRVKAISPFEPEPLYPSGAAAAAVTCDEIETAAHPHGQHGQRVPVTKYPFLLLRMSEGD